MSVDPVELLNSLAPAPGWNEPPDLETDQRAAAILERVVSGKVVPFRRPRRRLWIATGVVTTLAVGGAGVAAFLQRDADVKVTIACVSDASPDPEITVELGWDGVADPRATCAAAWEDGTLGTDGPPAPLETCLNDAGVVVVVPDEDACAASGRLPYTHTGEEQPPGDDDADAMALRRLLLRRYNSTTCVSEAEAVAGVQRTLDEFGFDGWATETRGTFDASAPCASTSVEPAAARVIITSIAGSSGEASN